MFERFTDQARRAVVLAQEEARMLNHNYIGTEHILLGLLHEGEGAAGRALESLGVTLEPARLQIEGIIGRGQHAQSGHIPFTPRAKKVLELSLRESLQLGSDSIGAGHILLGLLREGDGVAVQVLVRMGVDLNRARQEVIKEITSEPPPSQGQTGSPGEAGSEPRAGVRSATAVGSPRASEPGHIPGPRGGVRELWLTEMQSKLADVHSALAEIMARLTAIERHLGVTGHSRESGHLEDAAQAEDAVHPEDSGRAEDVGSAEGPEHAEQVGRAEDSDEPPDEVRAPGG